MPNTQRHVYGQCIHVRSTKRPELLIYISLLDRKACHHLPQVTHVSPCLPSFNPSYPPCLTSFTQVTHVSPCLPSFTTSYQRFTLFTLIEPKLPMFHPVNPHLSQVTHVSPCLPSFTPSYPSLSLFTLI